MATTIRGSDNFDTAPAGLGKVVQAQQTAIASTGYWQSITSTSLVPISGFEVTITPEHDNSDVLVNVCLNSGNTNNITWMAYGLYRNGVLVATTQQYAYEQYQITNNQIFNYLDSNVTTADTPITYSVYAAIPSATGTLQIHWSAGYGINITSTITAMEIAQ